MVGLLGGCYAVAREPGVFARVLLCGAREPGWLLGCCYAVARVTGVVARVLLGYPGWLLRCCYAVARVLGVVARVPGVVAKVLLWSC